MSDTPQGSAACPDCGLPAKYAHPPIHPPLVDDSATLLRNRAARMDIWHEVALERIRAHDKHGDTSMESAPAEDVTGRRYRILCEEIGEVAKEFNDAEHDRRPVDLAKLRKELIQVSAMAGAWADVCC